MHATVTLFCQPFSVISYKSRSFLGYFSIIRSSLPPSRTRTESNPGLFPYGKKISTVYFFISYFSATHSNLLYDAPICIKYSNSSLPILQRGCPDHFNLNYYLRQKIELFSWMPRLGRPTVMARHPPFLQGELE